MPTWESLQLPLRLLASGLKLVPRHITLCSAVATLLTTSASPDFPSLFPSRRPLFSMASDGEDDRHDKEKDRRKRLAVSPIAKPLAGKKLTKKTLKVVKKGMGTFVSGTESFQRAASSKQLKRGVKEVVKAIRKGQKGLVIIAGDISPIDVITHVPILCEDANIPYLYVPSKEDLGGAGSTKRPTSCLLVLPVPPKGGVSEEDSAKFKVSLDELVKEVRILSQAIYG